MGRSQESFNKKEKEKKRRKKKQEKQERREQRKALKAVNGGTSFEKMLAYVDEDGNLTTTPPDPSKKKEIKAEDIILGATPIDKTPMETIRKGRVKFFNHEKGYGFIVDSETKESVFVHINNCPDELHENQQVTFEIEMGPKGPNAVMVALQVPEAKQVAKPEENELDSADENEEPKEENVKAKEEENVKAKEEENVKAKEEDVDAENEE